MDNFNTFLKYFYVWHTETYSSFGIISSGKTVPILSLKKRLRRSRLDIPEQGYRLRILNVERFD